jgi:uroporphyrinogen-III synthase
MPSSAAPLMNQPIAFLVTRPGPAGRSLAEALQARGAESLWLPAFELGPAPDPAAVTATLRRLAEFDLAVFVSPAAVRGAAAALPPRWPATTRAAVVGHATAGALRAHYASAPPPVIEPSGRAEAGGSEALWETLAAQGMAGQAAPRAVLILRAAHGREWLGERLREAGARVETLAVYTRTPCAAPIEARERLAQWRASQAIATVLTSSEAVGVLAQQLAPDPALRAAVFSGRALASHDRVAAAARAAGFAQVSVAAPEVETILAMTR